MKVNYPHLVPSILTSNFLHIEKEIRALEDANIHYLHLDIMDGHFVPNLTFGPEIIRQIRQHTNMVLDTHLMISNPDKFIDAYADAGADYITIHLETNVNIFHTLTHIKKRGCKAGLAFNPDTPLDTLEDFLPKLDLILIMSVFPGFGGQKFMNTMLQKITEAKAIIKSNSSNALIEIDGGIKVENINDSFKAGADLIVAGSSVFNNIQTPQENIRQLLDACKR